MAKNYTDDQTKHMIEVYQTNPTRETVDKLATEMGKTVKSVIGKLSREKVYVKKDYTTKRGEKPITKLEMVQEIADMLQGDKERLQTLEKSSKAELLYLKVLVEDLKEGFQYENLSDRNGIYQNSSRTSSVSTTDSNIIQGGTMMKDNSIMIFLLIMVIVPIIIGYVFKLGAVL